MIPPIEPSILQNNPQFAELHATLTTSILNPTGSSRVYNGQKEHEALRADLHTARVRAAKSSLIRSTLQTLELTAPQSSSNTTSNTLPKPGHITRPAAPARAVNTEEEEPSKLPQGTPHDGAQQPDTQLTQLILLLTSHLLTPTPDAHQQETLESTPLWQTLPDQLAGISFQLSAQLHAHALALTRIASPTTNTSYIHRQIPTLGDTVRGLQDALTAQTERLGATRIRLAGKTTLLLARYHALTTALITALETDKHGALARHLDARVQSLALAARHLELEAQHRRLRATAAVYTPQVNAALANYLAHLRDETDRARDKRRDAERVLYGYGVGREAGDKGKVMREIARVYEDLMRETREVERDLKRLKRG